MSSRSRDHHDALSSGIGSLSMSSREDSTGPGLNPHSNAVSSGSTGYLDPHHVSSGRAQHIEKLAVQQAHPAAGYDNHHHQQPHHSHHHGGSSGRHGRSSQGHGGGQATPPGGPQLSSANYHQQGSGGGGKMQHHHSERQQHQHHSHQQYTGSAGGNSMSHYNGVSNKSSTGGGGGVVPSLPGGALLEPTSPTADGPLQPHQPHHHHHSPHHHGHHHATRTSPPPLATGSTSLHQHHHHQQHHAGSNSLSAIECSRPAQGFSDHFERLRQDCRRQGLLYSDPRFPAADTSLFYSRQSTASAATTAAAAAGSFPVTWMRPAEISRQYNMTPEFRAVTPHNRACDLKQGEMGDCWLVDSIACLLVHDCERHQLFHRVVPPGQSFSSSWYAGIFCFRFWRSGSWQEVIIDDLLPTRNGRLVFVHSEKVNEFWGALLEKAYAKLNGCYESLKGGLIGDAMTDVTGGLTELYSLEYASSKSILPPKDIDDVLIKAFDRHSLVGAGISERKCLVGSGSRILGNGLVAGHAYALTDTRKIRLKDEGGERLVTLVRLRNPWSQEETEWTGPWCERSAEWRSIPQLDRTNVGLVKGEGEFWMSLEDFLSNFDTLYLCHLPPSLTPVTVRLWSIHDFLGSWRRGVTAGGRPYLRHLHWSNPQYRLVLGGPDPGDLSGQCSFLVGLMQLRGERCHASNAAAGVSSASTVTASIVVGDVGIRPQPLVSIGFIIYKLPAKMSCPLPRHFFERTNWLVSVDYFVNAREVVKRFRLPPGNYVLVPCTYDPDQESSFLLRIFFEHGACTAEYPEGRLESFQPAGPGFEPGPPAETRPGWMRRYISTAATAGTVLSGAKEEVGEPSDGSIDAFQLQRLLNMVLREEQFYAEISIEACKGLVCLVDGEQLTFRVSETDLSRLWPSLTLWIRIFRQSDVDRTGSIPIIELRNAFSNLGYFVPPRLVMRLVHRYADPDFRISFSNFVTIMALLKKVFDSFKKHDTTGKVVLSLEEYFEVALLL